MWHLFFDQRAEELVQFCASLMLLTSAIPVRLVVAEHLTNVAYEVTVIRVNTGVQILDQDPQIDVRLHLLPVIGCLRMSKRISVSN